MQKEHLASRRLLTSSSLHYDSQSPGSKIRFMIVKPKWIVVVVFWILFLLSVASSEEYPSVKYVWSAALLLFLLATFINFAFQFVRYGGDTRAIRDRGYPRWFMRFALDEDEQTKRQRRRPPAKGRAR